MQQAFVDVLHIRLRPLLTACDDMLASTAPTGHDALRERG